MCQWMDERKLERSGLATKRILEYVLGICIVVWMCSVVYDVEGEM